MNDHRARHKEKTDRAHELQVRSGIIGAVKATTYALLLTSLTHYTWPAFRRQTLALKGFIVSSATMFGLVVGADSALLAHESQQRFVEDRLRREARRDLAREGKLGTEPEIAKWMTRREAAMREAEQNASSISTSPDLPAVSEQVK
ncbi:hypothetical protein M422DRAFT_773347 [Sphaerobolus stellatus SS14]|nr:hypothetical protein M422DRAFT_773347 [Sphaerobolus stellatus SS14]